MIPWKRNLAKQVEEERNNIDEIIKNLSYKIKDDDKLKIRNIITPLNPYDKIYALNSITDDDFRNIIRNVYDLIESFSINELSESKIKILIDLLDIDSMESIISRLETDEIIKLIEGIDDSLIEKIFSVMPRSDRKNVKLALNYDENQIGRFIETDFVIVNQNLNIEEAVHEIKKLGDYLPNETRDIFVADEENGNLIGMINITSIIIQNYDTPIMSILNTDFKTILDTSDKSEAVYFFRKYNLTTLPVISEQGKMIGFISSDVANEISEEESDEDIFRLAGITNEHEKGIFKNANIRFVWLFVNLISAFLSASVISKFESTISKYSFLAALIPIAASMGGNSGLQTTAVMLRMITLKSINSVNKYRIFFKELSIGLINSIFFVIICFIISTLLHNDYKIGIIFSIAVSVNILLSSFFGFIIPLIMKKIGTDPAITSTVILTTITDFFGFVILLYLASRIFQ